MALVRMRNFITMAALLCSAAGRAMVMIDDFSSGEGELPGYGFTFGTMLGGTRLSHMAGVGCSVSAGAWRSNYPNIFDQYVLMYGFAPSESGIVKNPLHLDLSNLTHLEFRVRCVQEGDTTAARVWPVFEFLAAYSSGSGGGVSIDWISTTDSWRTYTLPIGPTNTGSWTDLHTLRLTWSLRTAPVPYQTRIEFDYFALVPEPPTYATLALSLAGVMGLRRHRRAGLRR